MIYYNTNIIIKYQQIEDELLTKIQNRPSNYIPEDKDEHIYSKDDVINICKELYKNEIKLVFFKDETPFDLNLLDASLGQLYNIMIKDTKFKTFFRNLLQNVLSNYMHINDSEQYLQNNNLHQDIFATLFSQQLFHITHLIICNKLTNSPTDDNLFKKLNLLSIDVIKNNFSL